MTSEYYQTFFPVDTVYRFLTQHEPLSKREIAFKTDYRYNVAMNKTNFGLILAHGPNEVQVGGVYNKPPFVENKSSVWCVGSELRIDIDDYPECKSCEYKLICARCWAYEMAPRMKKVLAELACYYECQNMQVLYSGGRSAHAWISDESVFYGADDSVRKYFLTQLMSRLKNNNIKLDEAVFTQQAHLTRCPFSINPRGNRVCVAVNLDSAGSPPFVLPKQENELKQSVWLFEQRLPKNGAV